MGNWIVQQWLFQYLVKVHGHPCKQYIFCLYISSTFKAIKTYYVLMKDHWHASAKKKTNCLHFSTGIWRTAVIRCSGVHQLGRCSQRSVSSLVSAKIGIIQSGILQVQYYVLSFSSSSFFSSFFCLNTWTYEHLEMSSKCFKWQLYSAPLCFRAETLHSSHNYAIEWVTEGLRSTFGISTRVGTVLFGYCMPDALWSCCCFGAHSVYSYNHAPVYRITLSEAAYIRCMFV